MNQASQNPSHSMNPGLLAALVPTVSLILLLSSSVYLFGDGSSSGPNQIALLVGAIIAALMGARAGLHWHEMEEAIRNGISIALGAILILLAVGSLIGSWMLSGTVPTLTYYGLLIMNPDYFYVAVCAVCALVSLSIGSSWTTAGTIGVAFVGIALGLGLSPEITAGAIISGAYFGDKMSPLSDTTNLAAAVVGSDLFSHIRNMSWTTGPSILICLLFFGWAGMSSTEIVQGEQLQSTLLILDDLFVINVGMLTPLVVLIWMAVKKQPALPTILAGTAVACLLAVGFQQDLLARMTGTESGNGFLDGLKAVWTVLFAGFAIDTGDPILTDLLGRGGMSSMLNTVWLIISAMVFGSIMERTGMLAALVKGLLKWADSTGSLILTTVMTCIGINIMAADQYISIVLPGRMYKLAFAKQGLDGLALSRTLEDAGTITSPLIPWNTCGAYMAATLGVSTLAYLPFCVFNLVCPAVAIMFGLLGIRIVPLTDRPCS